MTTKIGLSPAAPQHAAQSAQSFASKAVQKAQLVGSRTLNLATSPLAVYSTVSTAVIVLGTGSSLLRGAAVNAMAHLLALPASIVYSNFLRSRVAKGAEQIVPAKTESAVLEITQQNYKKEVLESKLPVVLEAYTDWCPPCKAMAPIMDGLSNEMKGKFKFSKINTDKQPALAKELKIEAMPTFIYFKGGKIIDRQVGAMPKGEMLTRCINLFL